MKSIALIVYIVIGLLVAAQKDYLGDIGSVGDIINLLLAVLLWPLVLLGVKFNIKVGGDGDKKGSLLIPVALHHLHRLRSCRTTRRHNRSADGAETRSPA